MSKFIPALHKNLIFNGECRNIENKDRFDVAYRDISKEDLELSNVNENQIKKLRNVG